MTYLLDVNVLIALIDPNHIHHGPAHRWFSEARRSWATCPIVENGVVRILSNPRYPLRETPSPPSHVARLLSGIRASDGHVFWPDSVSLLDSAAFDLEKLVHSRQITDSYLCALAVRHGGRFASFDADIKTDAVHHAGTVLHLIPTG